MFRDKKHPYGFREYSIEMDDPYHEPPLRHQGLCLQVGSPTDEEITGFVDLARRFRQQHGEAFFLGYFAWPAIPEAAALKKELKLEPWQLIPLRHAVSHRSDPGKLDASCFNEPKSYPPDAMDPARKRGQGKANVVVRDDDYDNGPHLPITPEGKRLVDETIRAMLAD